MALFIRQDEERTELQKRVAADVSNRSREKAKKLNENPDGVDDSRYIEGTKTATGLTWLWVLMIVIAVGIVIWLTLVSMAR
jgi:hypothetical protein